MSEKKRTIPNYSLSLANGHSWNIHADQNIEKWLSNFAEILSLSKTLTLSNASDFYITPEENAADQFFHGSWLELPNRYVRLFLSKKNRDILCILNRDLLNSRIDETVLMLFVMQGIFASEIQSGGLPLHAAMVHWKGNGILLAAQGGVGKSTCATRLPESWNAIADDTCLAVHSNENKYSIHPLPTWSVFFDNQDWGASWMVERSFPIQLICFLERSDSDDIIPLGNGEAAASIYQSAMQVWRGTQHLLSDPIMHKYWIKKIFQNSCSLSHGIPSAKLEFTKEGHFWENIESFLSRI